MKLRKTLIGALVGAAMLPGAANAAISWAWNYAGLNAAEGYAPGGTMSAVSATMNELKFTAESLIHWTSGTPFAAGSKFDDYILLRVDQYFLNSANVTEANYGSGFPLFGLPGNHEFTVKLKAQGRQTGANTYVIEALPEFGLYYDSGAGLVPYTQADFLPGNEARFSDSTLAEVGFLISGNGTNTTSGLPDGSIGMVVGLVDNLHNINGQVTELIPFQQLYLPLPFALGIADGNNNLCIDNGGTAACTDTKGSLMSYFGVAASESGKVYHTRTDGSLNKDVIPEPGSLALVGLALAGAGVVASRRRSKAA